MTSSGPPDPGPGSTVLVEVTGVDKRFGTTRALRGVGLSLRAGQCLGLVGRNGAGKSTLVSILSGLIEPDAGTVRFGGEPAPRVGDIGRWREWIATVFQHSMIVPDLSVAENVFLGNTSSVVSWRELRARTRAIMRDWGFDIDARTPCRELSVEQLQIVEIARALARGAKCVLLDEPTAALERQAARRLFDRVRQLTAGGVAVLYISHHLEEVFEICESVAVLRDGELVLTAPTATLDRDDLVAAMVGGVHRAGEHKAAEPAAGDAAGPARHRTWTPRPWCCRSTDWSQVRPAAASAVCHCACTPEKWWASPACSAREWPPSAAPWRARKATPRARSCCTAGACLPADVPPPSTRGSATSRRTGVPRVSSRTWAWRRT